MIAALMVGMSCALAACVVVSVLADLRDERAQEDYRQRAERCLGGDE